MFIPKSFHRSCTAVLILAFLGASVSGSVETHCYASSPGLPEPGHMVSLSPAYTPAHLMGLTIHPDNALKFDFLIHQGEGRLAKDDKKQEYTRLIKYFLASLTIPDKDQWVNLSPYEKNRIIEDNFGKTEIGRDLLAQDYLLKQITSSLMYPESGLGKAFWDKVYAKAWEQFHTTQIPVNTFNKVWIVPDKATIYENKGTAYIIQSHLKVMLEEDYLAMTKNNVGAGLAPAQDNRATARVAPTKEIIREIILPELEREVNEGKNFAQLRQIVSAMILATWYKKALKESLLGKIYADKAKVKGVNRDPKANEEIYQQYLKAFKKGVYNYIKEDEDKYTHQRVPRKYFAGGFDRAQMNEAVVTRLSPNVVRDAQKIWVDAAQTVDRVQTNLQPTAAGTNVDAAMQAPQVGKRIFASEQDKFWIEKLYPTWAFQAAEFEGSLEKIDPILRHLGQSKDRFNDINEAIAWLNRNIEQFQEYVKYSREHGISEEINKLIPENWEAIIANEKDLRRFALTIEGQRLKRAILGVLFSSETPKIAMASADEMKHARQYIDEKFSPMFRRIAIRNYYLARFISERFLGVKFDQDLNEIIQETHLYGLRVLQRYYSIPRIQSLNAYVYMSILRDFSAYLVQVWGLPGWTSDIERINALLMSTSQIIEEPTELHKDKILFSNDDVIAQLKSKQFSSRWITVLRIRRYIQQKNKMGTQDRFENLSVFRAGAARKLQKAIAASLASLGDRRHIMTVVHGYGLFGRDALTLEEMGKLPELNVTRERVRQMQAKMLRRMKHPSRIEKLEPFVEEYEDIGEASSESLSIPQMDSLTEALSYLDYEDEELIVRLHGMDGNEPLSYEEISREFALSVQEVKKAEERILSILSNKTDFSRDYLAAAKFAYLDRHRTLNPEHNAHEEPQRRTTPLTFEQEDELLSLLNIRGEIGGFQWRVLPLALKGYSIEEIAAVTNRTPEIVADARAKVSRKLRFVLNLDILDQFGPRDQIVEELIRLSSESLLQRLFRRTDMDELLAISQGDVEGIIEFIMQLYPGMYKEEEIRELARAHYKGVPSRSRPRSTSGTPPKEVLNTMHDVVARFNLNNTRRNRLVLRRLMRDRYYQTIVSNPQEGLSQLQSEIIALGKSKNPKDALWVALLKETYEYYQQVADFYPRGFEENTEYGKEPLQAAQRYGIREALQTLENPEFESSVHMSEARIGKTVMSVLSAYNIRNAQREYAVKRVIFTTSNQAKFEAAREIKRRTNKDLDLQVIVIDADPKKPSREEQIRAAIKLAGDKTKNIMIIANYEAVRDFPELIDQFQADAHIIDEIENLKAGGDTKRAPIILGRPIRYRIGISARPIINSAEDIVELLLWARHKTFAADGRDITEARAYLKGLGMDELFEALDPIKVRWRRKVVMPEVKDPIQEVEYIDFSPEHEKVILDMRDDFVAWKKTARSDKDYVDHVYTRQELERQASLDPGLVLSENVLVFTNRTKQSWTFEGASQNFVIDGIVYKKVSDFNNEIIFQDASGKNVYRVNLNDLSKPIRINGIVYTVENHKKNFMDISAKIKRLDQIIEEEVKNNGKIVIMVESVEEIQRLMARYNDPGRYGAGAAVGVYGEVLLENRLDDIWRFRSEQRPVILIGTTATIGSSINLFQVPGSTFRIKTMVRLSRPWANVDDADRLVGIGQDEQVRAITLVSRFREETQATLGRLETIEERMETLLKRKRGIAVRVIDGVPQMSDNDRERLKVFADSLMGRKRVDAASISQVKDDALGGIDLNAANLTMTIKRDGKGVALPLAQQDMALLSRIDGFEPNIIEIKPALNLPILSELVKVL